MQFTAAAQNKLWDEVPSPADEELQLHSRYSPKIIGIISCLDLRAARSSGVQTPFLKFTFYITSLQVLCWYLANSTAANKNIPGLSY